MNKSKLKSYAPQARKDFIAAVTARANLLGLSDKDGQLQIAPSQPQGDITLIAGQPWPTKVHGQRQQLIARLHKDGFAQTLEAVAYTWFNRFAALRYMELHDYLGHGHRALSSAQGTLPDILTHAADLAQSASLPGLNAAQVIDMKLAGNRDGELYRLLLVAQCNALNNAMPFLFERIDDETELLLPDNLLRTDSVIAKLVAAIDEEDWREIEIIGWLYQFYISEKKDAVIGKVVKSEDIPAATQLFTPNWIVQYLVQNSVGRLWLMANPASTLAGEWPYYIQPAEQTPEVTAQLDALIQTRIGEDGDTLNPETITCLDPACGSGHILVVAYDVLKAIYLERGYRLRDIPRLILEKNLFGLDIDDRAAQLAGFALLMKARADDRRLFNEPVQLNVLALQESKGLDAGKLVSALHPASSPAALEGAARSHAGFGDEDLFPETRPQMSLGESSAGPAVPGKDEGFALLQTAAQTLIRTFLHAKTFGSLLQIPAALNAALPALLEAVQQAQQSGDLYGQAAAQDLGPLVQQAQVLAMQFDAVVANPPYMGGKGMNLALKDYALDNFQDSKSDMFAMFMDRGFSWCKPTGFNSMVTMQSWMFLSSFQIMREKFLANFSLTSLVQLPYDGKGPTAMGISFGISIVVFTKTRTLGFLGDFDCFRYYELTEDGLPKSFPSKNERNVKANAEEFQSIPGSPIAFWISKKTHAAFGSGKPLREFAEPRKGMVTAENPRFIRFWSEVSFGKIGADLKSREEAKQSKKKWFPYQKGGDFRKWFGNNEAVVNWENDGSALLGMKDEGYKVGSTNHNLAYIFKSAITWTKVTSSTQSFRYSPNGFLFDDASGLCPVKDKIREFEILGFLNSKVSAHLLKATNPTINLNPGNLADLPISSQVHEADITVKECISVSEDDWNSYEVSFNFTSHPLIQSDGRGSLGFNWQKWCTRSEDAFTRMMELESHVNNLFINAYDLQDELTPEVPESQITLTRADREKDCQRLISYAIGCMMGRYSLDAPGLIYAHAGNVGFDASRYATFPADADGIVPLTDELWFDGDAASRIREFLLAVWGADTLAENMAWLAESLGAKTSETPIETIRRYLADKFFKDHLQTYKKRPIYWLFSSGKQGAFQALVYLHRYHEGTLARVRAEYVVPLTGKIQNRIDMLQKDALAAASTAARTKLAKEIEKLKKKHAELLAYDEILRHHADMRITLDLDNGVKVNYGKFGNLLAEVKAVTGGKDDE